MAAANRTTGPIAGAGGPLRPGADPLPPRSGRATARHSRIREVAVHLPERRESAEEIEDRLRAASPGIRVPSGLLRRLYGLEERLVAADDERASDLAAHAVDKALAQAGIAPEEVDLLLFAAVSADVQEPANAHVVAAKTGLTCPAFDLTNACNSVLNAIETADAFLRAGTYRRVLIACGEVGSRFSRWKLSGPAEVRTGIGALSGGDIGAAVLMEAAEEPGVLGGAFFSNSRGWPAATLFNPYQVRGEPLGLHIDSERLLGSFQSLRGPAGRWLEEQGRALKECDLVCVHQPSVPFVSTFCEWMDVPEHLIVPTFARTGNIAAATLPLQLVRAQEQGRLHPGAQVALFGLASGASAGIILLTW
ncbi:3-oxoacyl-ACP synthase III family protein [Streptomyces catenulae]|uniref:3-oxoacyl-[acyl-carrier-protein] synthase III C-terminal domain-containing protein n=1 Tax=Streptomyces catenulae TaxID=66875 RepID=A0ABV2YXI4_9ACTN|nr:3-oxoacyl-[acyl-carrier-protein] synthase III C-terminal domain-containing protein [Streptomyces catenulae]